MNQPSDEALKNLLRFLLNTSVPRILEERNLEHKQKGESNELNNNPNKQSIIS
ncbi:hypothetical protein ACQRXC_15045 [Niallia taxi]|uniref:hypothetical protein n=1 Tax=Niallia taxi TaxID=2499688 RepID=UPI003F62DE67